MARNTNTQPAHADQPANYPLCGCGCGVPTVTARATFLSGHDARLAGVLGRALATEDGLTKVQKQQYDRLTDRLRTKADGVAETARRKAAEKAAKVAAREAAKKAYEAALAATK